MVTVPSEPSFCGEKFRIYIVFVLNICRIRVVFVLYLYRVCIVSVFMIMLCDPRAFEERSSAGAVVNFSNRNARAASTRSNRWRRVVTDSGTTRLEWVVRPHCCAVFGVKKR